MNGRWREPGFILLPVVMTLAVVAVLALLLNRQGALDVNRAGAGLELAQARYLAEAGAAHGRWVVRESDCAATVDQSGLPLGSGTYSINYTSGGPSRLRVTGTGHGRDGASAQSSRTEATTSAPINKTYNPGSNVDDTYIDMASPSPGTLPVAGTVTLSESTNIQRGLVRMPLPTVGADVQLLSATLEMNLSGIASVEAGFPFRLDVHTMLTDWTESGAGWFDTGTGSPWLAPGAAADFDPVVLDSFNGTLVTGNVNPVQWNITPAAKQWLSGTRPNHGVLIRGEAGMENARLSSGDQGNLPKPVLRMNFLCTCGGDCTVTAPGEQFCQGSYAANTETGNWSSAAYNNAADIVFLPPGVVVSGYTVPADGAWALSINNSNNIHILDQSGVLQATLGVTTTGTTGVNSLAYVGTGPYAPALLLLHVQSTTSTLMLVGLDGSLLTSWTWLEKANQVTYIDHGDYAGHYVLGRDTDAVLFSAPGVQAGILTYPLEIARGSGLVYFPGANGMAIQNQADGLVLMVQMSGPVTSVATTETHRFYSTSFGMTNASRGIGHNRLSCDYALMDVANALVRTVNRVAGGSSVTVGATQDTALMEDSTVARGALETLDAGFDAGSGKAFRPLLQFDTSGLLPGTLLTDARIRLWMFNGGQSNTGPLSLKARNVLESWLAIYQGSNGADWIDRTKQTSTILQWSTPGGTFDPGWSTTTALDSAGPDGWVEFEITALAQEWIDNPANNHGVLLVPEPGVNRAKFRSRDYEFPAFYPQLVLTY